MKLIRIKYFVVCLFSFYIGKSSPFEVESRAIDCVIEFILEEEAIPTSLVWSLLSSEGKEFKNFSSGRYYSNNQLCLVTTPAFKPESEEIGLAQMNYQKFLFSFDSLTVIDDRKSEFSNERLKFSSFVHFTQLAKDGDYFFSARHHLVGEEVRLSGHSARAMHLCSSASSRLFSKVNCWKASAIASRFISAATTGDRGSRNCG